MEPVERRDGPRFDRSAAKRLVAWLLLLPVAFVVETLSETSGGLVTFQPEFVEAHGQEFLFVPIIVAALLAFGLVFYRQRRVETEV